MVKRWNFDRTIKRSSFSIPGGAEEYYFVIEQTPLTRDSLVLFSYHLKKGTGKFQKEILDNGSEPWGTGMVVKGDHYSMVWSSNQAEI